ncbi:MAG: hypothetical protein ACFFAO_09585 [Candidatus Hermodarchaeota archaeon]
MVEKECINCGGKNFRIVHDEWMRRTFRFVEQGTLEMCEGCGWKYLICKQCGGLFTRVHPALEAWEVNQKCPNCGYEDPEVKAWDGVSAR